MKRSKRLLQNKDDLHDLGSDDLLSRFSDDILVSILSYLPLKDAAITSKLSRRWRYLWCQTRRLNFEDKEIENGQTDLEEKNKYINWVNRVTKNHKGPTIDEFKICFDLDKTAKGAIGNWIEFAISKNVQTLELDLKADRWHRRWRRRNYVFPNKIFDRKCGSMEMKFLKTLILNLVDLNDEGLSKILSNCPVLEHLSIRGSMHTVKPKFHGKNLALKNLEITDCEEVELIEICDSNIVSFNYYGSPFTLTLDDLPKLEKMCIGAFINSWMKINYLFCAIPYIQVLELQTYHPQENMHLLLLPELPNLKQLVMKVKVVCVKAWDDGSLSVLTSLVEASPNLQRFTIKLKSPWSYQEPITNWEVMQVAKQPHQHLEVVEIRGYHGRTSDFELAMHLIENGVSLKKLVIKPYVRKFGLETHEITEKKIAARYRAGKQLKPKTPVDVDLVML